MVNVFKINKPFLIAEIGGNHQGNFPYAKKLLNLAIESKVDCIKFQLYTGDSLVNKTLSKDRNSHFKKFELSKDQHIYLAKKTIDHKIQYNASVWDIGMLDWIDDYLTFYKVGSGDLTNLPLIRELTKRKKPIVLSTGLANNYEIEKTIDFIKNQSNFYNIEHNLCLLQCTSMYPIENDEANLNCISFFKKKYNSFVGYSDHTIGYEALIIASILGSEILEFHFTDNKGEKSFRDHQVSLTKSDVYNLKKIIEKNKKFLGKPVKFPQPSEIKNNHLSTFRRAVYPQTNIKKGMIIKKENLCTLRPNIGTCASDFDKVVGCIALRDLEPLQILKKGIDFSNSINN